MDPSLRSDLALLDKGSLEELMDRFPERWKVVGERLVAATETKSTAAIEAFVRQARDEAAPWRVKLAKNPRNMQIAADALPFLAAAKMATLATDRILFAAATGQEGTARFGFWSGTLVQHLFFLRGLERWPVSMTKFRLLWPLVTQKRLLMPLVQPKGIYCFYSRELVRAMAALIGDRTALEIAAGDGTLTRFLSTFGASIRATDDQSWGHSVSYPADVENLDAAAALARYKPRAVVCSFPPPGNTFEKRVFATREVELYVVVTTRHRFAAGNWKAYEEQDAFDWAPDEKLAKLVLPPEVDPTVLVFRRR